MSNRESVWDYPRPPALVHDKRHVRIIAGGALLAESHCPILVKETSHPPVYFLPPSDVQEDLLRRSRKVSFCEWKGQACYFDVVIRTMVLRNVAFCYETPLERFAELAGWYSFYAGPMDSVTVDGEPVTPQEGGFYSGWITSELDGPFKGAPGTFGW